MSGAVGQAYRGKAAALAARLRDEVARLDYAPQQENRFSNAYHLADANLRYFFPGLTAEGRKAIITDVFFQQGMALLDQGEFKLVETTRLDDRAGVFGPGQAGRGRIFCTYHAGSYRHLFHFFSRAGIDCLLFLAGKTLDQQGESFLREAHRAYQTQGWTGQFSTLNAQNSTSLLQGLRALKRGTSLVLYIDGNAGVGANRESDSLMPVEFFGHEIMARTGIAYLSHLSGAPVVPVLCSRDGDHGLTLTLHEAITPAGMAREPYVASTTKALYALLSREIAAAPGQWEGWLYVERYLKRGPALPVTAFAAPAAACTLVANLERFALLVYGTQAVLLDKARHSCVMLDAASASVFRGAAHAPLPYAGALDASAGVVRLLSMGALCAAP